MPCLSLFRIILSINGSSAASVLPEPVGAIMRTLSPWAIRGMASTCGGVGFEIPVSWSSPFSGGERRAKASGAMDATGQLIGLESSEIKFLGDQKHGVFQPLFLFGYFLQEVLVVRRFHEARQFFLQILRSDYCDPSFSVGVLVDQFGSIGERVVDLDYSS